MNKYLFLGLGIYMIVTLFLNLTLCVLSGILIVACYFKFRRDI